MSEIELRPGVRLFSTSCATEVIVVKGGGSAVVTCGGTPMVTDGQRELVAPVGDISPTTATKVGKRYTTAAGDVELLCTRGGDGSIVIDGEAVGALDPKLLPSSD